MRLAVVSDIHGNLPALAAVRADIAASGVDAVVNLGDTISGPLWPAETADHLMAFDWPTLAGNHERQVLAPITEAMSATDRHAAERLADTHRAWLGGLPTGLRLGDEVLACHGTPTNDLVYLMETVVDDFAGPQAPGIRAATAAEVAERAGDRLAGEAHAVILCGHSHVPRTLQLFDGRLVVNPGSVGLQAYDDEFPWRHLVETRTPHARYALITRRATGWQVEHRAVPYDWEAAAAQADANGRPDWSHALRTGMAMVPAGWR